MTKRIYCKYIIVVAYILSSNLFSQTKLCLIIQ